MVTDLRGEELAVYRVFSAVFVQDVIAEEVGVTLELMSKNKMLQEAKLLVTYVLRGTLLWNLGLLHGFPRLDVLGDDESVNRGLKERSHFFEPTYGLVKSQNWDHNLRFIFEDMISQSS